MSKIILEPTQDDSFFFKLEKTLDEDWTKNCKAKTVDTMAFVNKMQAIRAGQSVEWKCPFCGANVILMKNEDEHTIIGCEECDIFRMCLRIINRLEVRL